MNKDIFFSIIIPTFNRVKKIKSAINSVLNQTYQNWELIIVDNKSTDNTKQLVKSYNNKKIFFYEIDNEGIIAKSRNFGIEKAFGEYLCFLDSDDCWDKDKLKFVNLAAKKGYSFIYHDHYVYAPKRLISKRKIKNKSLTNPVFNNLIEYGQPFATSSVVVKKNIFKKINYFDTNRKYIAWEDFDAWIRLSKITTSFYKVNKTLSIINIDNENFLNDKLKIKNTYLFIDKYIEKSKKIPNWCLYTILVAEYNLSNLKEVKKILNQITFLNLNFAKKINFIKILFFSFFK